MPLSGVASSTRQDTGNQSQHECLRIPRNPTVTKSTDRRISSQSTRICLQESDIGPEIMPDYVNKNTRGSSYVPKEYQVTRTGEKRNENKMRSGSSPSREGTRSLFVGRTVSPS